MEGIILSIEKKHEEHKYHFFSLNSGCWWLHHALIFYPYTPCSAKFPHTSIQFQSGDPSWNGTVNISLWGPMFDVCQWFSNQNCSANKWKTDFFLFISQYCSLWHENQTLFFPIHVSTSIKAAFVGEHTNGRRAGLGLSWFACLLQSWHGWEG